MPPPAPRLPLVTCVMLLALAVGASACRWSYPADPGRRRSGREGPVPEGAAAAPEAVPGTDPGARAIYLTRCGQCHEPFDPGYATAAEWPMFVARYGPRAGLAGRERDRVLSWLQANAGR